MVAKPAKKSASKPQRKSAWQFLEADRIQLHPTRVRMKPHVICLMASSVDGRTLHSRWRPKGSGADLFECVHDELAGDAWLVGRVTGQEFAKGKPYPTSTRESFPREHWFARRGAQAFGGVLDAQGKIGCARSDIGGDPVLVVLSEKVSDAHLAGLRGDGV